MPSTSGDASDAVVVKNTEITDTFQCPQHRAMHLTSRLPLGNDGTAFQCPQYRAMHLTKAIKFAWGVMHEFQCPQYRAMHLT